MESRGRKEREGRGWSMKQLIHSPGSAVGLVKLSKYADGTTK